MNAIFSRTQALAWTGGHPMGELPAGFSGVSTDTRSLAPGDLFVALRGERFDGHAYLAAAGDAGAGAALISDELTLDPSLKIPRLAVRDPLTALAALARGYRELFSPTVVAVTGSVGKTSTKELLAAALSPLGPVLKTAGNFNNEIGLPLTLFGLRAAHRAAVLEMGMNHAGEIARLTAIGLPSIGIVLNARGVHLEQLGSIENVAKAKGELFAGLPPKGVAVANADDALVLAQARASGRRTLTFGTAATADVRLAGSDDRGLLGVELTCVIAGEPHHTRLGLLGAHNALNACAALAGALAAGVDSRAAVAALSLARPAPHRLAIVQIADGITLLDDCYNASPSSMKAALETLRRAALGRRLGAILGDMLELGPGEQALHEEVGLACHGLSFLLCVGPRAAAIATAARRVGVSAVHTVSEGEVAAGVSWLQLHLEAGDALLLKGSRGMRLERFGEALGAAAGGGH